MLNKIALLDNSCMLMGNFNIDCVTSLKYLGNNVTSKFSKVMISCFFGRYIQQPKRVVVLSATLIDNIFKNSVDVLTVSDNVQCHLLQFLVLKNFRPKHEQIFKRSYTFFNNNEFKKEINEIDWKTSFDSHDFNFFQKFLHILTCVSDDHAQIKKLLKKIRRLSLKNHGLIIPYDI